MVECQCGSLREWCHGVEVEVEVGVDGLRGRGKILVMFSLVFRCGVGRCCNALTNGCDVVDQL